LELDASLPWLALTMTQGIAARLSARLLEEFGSPDEVFRAPLPHLERCNLPAAVAQAVFKKQAFKRAEKELATIRTIENVRLVNWTDVEYPRMLREIYDPPTLLYVRGNVEVLSQPAVSIVGTRNPTLYGTQMAERLGRELAARGVTIVSGMARGIDAISHQGAMAVNGRAIGVLGTGVNVCYPKENKSSMKRCWSGGRSSANFRSGPTRLLRISRFGTRLWLGCPPGWLWLREHSIADRLLRLGWRWNLGARFSGFLGT
jgi:DNA processing protein